MISEFRYIISEFGYDIRLVKSCVTTLYGFLTQMAPHTLIHKLSLNYSISQMYVMCLFMYSTYVCIHFTSHYLYVQNLSIYFRNYTIKSSSNQITHMLSRDDISSSDNQCHNTTCARSVTSDNDDEELRWVSCVAHDLIVSNIHIN